MRKLGTAFAIIFSVWFFVACRTGKEAVKTTNNSKGDAILEFANGTNVLKSEFEYVYQKNNGGWDEAGNHSQAQFQEYLDLYINFKRKVMEAESLGLDETEAFKTEFEGYRKQLSQPYLVEKDVQEGLIKEAHDRMQWMVSASHILVMVDPEASPADTVKAFRKISTYRDSVLKGGDFGQVARKYSQDPSAKDNLGYLGYFSAFDMVYPFESAAFKTNVGTVSKPVRTSFGYHILKVHDKIKNSGKKSIAHIIIRIGPQYSAKDTAQAKSKINEIYQKLQAGEDFATLASSYSDDGTSSKRGGDLGDGRLIPQMEEIKLKLKEGEYSEPFNTAFGWHIMTVTKAEPMKSFEESQTFLKSKISRDARSYLSREKLISRVKSDYGFIFNQSAVDKFNGTIKDVNVYSKGFWKPVDSIHNGIKTNTLFSLGQDDMKKTATMGDFMDFYLNNRKGTDGKTVEAVTSKLMKKFVEQEVLAYEEAQLPNKYPEYRELVKEYRDGILLFTLTEDKVWRKAVEDTTGLKNYYEANKEKFQAGERVKVKEYEADNKESLMKVQDLLDKGTADKDIDVLVNKESSLNLKIRTLTYEKGTDKPGVDIYGKPIGYRTDIVKVGEKHKIVMVMGSFGAGFKTFEESKSEAITQYQNYLEESWLAELEKKYPVKVNENVFNTLYK